MTDRETASVQGKGPCRVCGGRGWHTAGGNDPAACGACDAGEAWYGGASAPPVPVPSDEAPATVTLAWCPSCGRLAFGINPLHDCSMTAAFAACPGVPLKLTYQREDDLPRLLAEARTATLRDVEAWLEAREVGTARIADFHREFASHSNPEAE